MIMVKNVRPSERKYLMRSSALRVMVCRVHANDLAAAGVPLLSLAASRGAGALQFILFIDQRIRYVVYILPVAQELRQRRKSQNSGCADDSA
jgi:hypothetical protein